MAEARSNGERMPNLVGEKRWRSPRSEVVIWMASPTVMRFKYYGFSEATCVRWMSETADTFIRENKPPIDMFVDCWEQEGYEPGFRAGLTEWNHRIRPNIRSMALLIRSKIAAMGISVSNIILGGLLVPYTDAARFETEAAVAIRRGNRVAQADRPTA